MASPSSIIIVGSSEQDIAFALGNSLRPILEELITASLRSAHGRQNVTEEERDKLIPKREASRRLGVSLSTIDNMRRAGKLERIHVGKAVRFRLSDVQALMNKSK